MRIEAGSATAFDIENILVDGMELKHVVAVDEHEGYVEYCPKDDAGNYLIEQDSIVHRRIAGHVKIIWKK